MRILHVLRKLRALSWPERIAVLKVALLLMGTRVALRVLPFQSVLGWAEATSRRDGSERRLSPQTWRLVHTIETVGHGLFPRNPCLTQALAVQRLLRRRGHASEIRIGVRKGMAKRLEGHAWVECNGEVVIGARGMAEDHVTLPPLRSGPSTA